MKERIMITKLKQIVGEEIKKTKDASKRRYPTLSKKEREKARKRRIMGQTPEDQVEMDKDLAGLSRGVIRDHNPAHSGKDGKFSDYSDDGSWSSGGKQHTRSGRKKGGSTAKCGRKPRSSGKHHRCKDGSLKEQDEIDAIQTLRDIIRQEIEAYLNPAPERMSPPPPGGYPVLDTSSIHAEKISGYFRIYRGVKL